MRDAGTDAVVMRAVYLPKVLDDRIRSAAFGSNLHESELIAKLIEAGLSDAPYAAPRRGGPNATPGGVARAVENVERGREPRASRTTDEVID